MKNQFKNRLYRLTWAVLVSSLMLLSSCGDDEDDVNLAEAIVGTWREISYEFRNCNDPADDDSGTCTGDVNSICETLIFNSDGTVDDGLAIVPYTVEGNSIKVNNRTIMASISDNVLTLTYDNPNDGCTDIFRYRKR